MNQFNLLAPFGNNPLRFPFWTKWTRDDWVYIVSNPNDKVKVGDEIFVALEQTNINGEKEYSYSIKPHKVVSILEEIKAKGTYNVDFEPLFQKAKV